MYVDSVQIISRLDSQSKVQMLTHKLIPAAMLKENRAPPCMTCQGSVNLRKTFRRISEVWENAET